jgi:hypothetical protein
LQVVYTSSLTQDSESTLADILAASARNNAAADVTGMLLYADQQFLQVLEGPAPAVLRTYHRVHLDPRHTHMIELFHDSIGQREFGNWSMGFRKLKAQDAKDFPELAPYFRFGFNIDQIQGKPGAALELLRHFAHLQQ